MGYVLLNRYNEGMGTKMKGKVEGMTCGGICGESPEVLQGILELLPH